MKKLDFCFIAAAFFLLGCQEGLENEMPLNQHYSTQVQALSELGIHIDQEILKCMDNPRACKKELDIIVVFDDSPEEEPIEDISFEVIESEKFLNGKKITEKEEQALYDRLSKRKNNLSHKIVEKRQSIIDKIYDLEVTLDSKDAGDYIRGNDLLHAHLSVDDIYKIIKLENILGVEIYKEPSDDSLQSAMYATYVTQGASFTYNRGGQDVGIYMSETGCAPDGFITNYTRLDGSDTEHSRNVSSIIRTISPNSHLYCQSGCKLPTTDMVAPGAQGDNPDILFSTFSCSSGSSSTYSSYAKSFDDFVYNTGVTIVKSAGNNGTGTGYLGSQAAAMNILTIGNYNDVNNTPASFVIHSSSSYKNTTDTKSAKPELSAPGTSINAGTNVSGNTITMTGTSQATPHVTGMLANRGSSWSSPNINSITPSLMRVMALNGARDHVQGGYDKVGVGGADFYKLYNMAVYGWIEGNYTSIAANDGNDNGVIDKSFTTYSSTSKVRLVVSWLNRGTWVYAHKNDPFPAGADYGIIVYDPDGDVVATHWNPFDGFAVMDFDTPKVGQYKLQISRTAYRDTSAKLKMAWGATFN